MTRHKGITKAEVIVIVAFCVIVAVWILRSSRPRISQNRVYCSFNLGGTAKGLAFYALNNNNVWPVIAHKVPTTTAPSGEVSYVRQIGAKRGAASQPEAGETTPESTEVSTTRMLWYLIRIGASSPKSFICRSSGFFGDDQSNEDDDPAAYWDFGIGDQVAEGMGKQDPAANWRQVSYGYQVPFGRLGKAAADSDEHLAVAADKGPYGAWLEAGRGRDPGVPVASASDRAKNWRQWNSLNHDSEGQNVVYPDGHTEWHATPLAGVNKDNIYTQWSSFVPDENGRVRGRPPTLNGREVPMGDTDTLLYP